MDDQGEIYSEEQMLYKDALEIYKRAMSGKKVDPKLLEIANSFLSTNLSLALYLETKENSESGEFSEFSYDDE